MELGETADGITSRRAVTRLLTRSFVGLGTGESFARFRKQTQYVWVQLLEGAKLDHRAESPVACPLSGLKFAAVSGENPHRSVIVPPFPSRCHATEPALIALLKYWTSASQARHAAARITTSVVGRLHQTRLRQLG